VTVRCPPLCLSVCISPQRRRTAANRCYRFAAVGVVGRRYRSIATWRAAAAAFDCGQCHVVSVRTMNTDLFSCEKLPHFLLLTDVATPLCYTAMHIRSAVADWREWDIAVHTSFKFFPHSLHSASTKLCGCIFVSKHSTLVVTYIAAWSKDEFSATVSSAKVATRLGLSPRNRQQTTLLMMLTTCILSPNFVKSSTFEIDDNL